ncbi:hypothetical protein FisN_6Lh424 [Fistulifera solaris]|uniref:Sugar phosphate transporter domain-containing protein n=1 Tax=Fistulifera solaris TaxID=1519565 RepID=A0A1Z5JKU8_FISSO|nr:hypothetical protein FisN_6Lh424 [Fistulifera solaris]|eukprot:GAX14640.1 hypothetical protein FisN_6Lh424 [Fistulifera solaris]
MVAAWYNTNGMNGISMQSFAGFMKELVQTEDNPMTKSLFTITAITSVVTALQLFLGALVGYVLLLLHAVLSIPTQQAFRSPDSSAFVTFQFRESLSSALHGIGSICTNLGFMYGSASLVQIIKLLEPFEILLLTRIFLPEERKLLTMGVASSMILTVGAAISLIQFKNSQPHVHAVTFALLSGFTLSMRNVLQRQQYNSSLLQPLNSSPPSTSVLEKSLMQFTKLSWQSAWLMLAFSIVLFLLLGLHQSPAAAFKVFYAAIQGINWGILTWHPMYNSLSMITLGYCSALTHSLLNAGKRVFAIVMAITWFREDVTRGTMVGLTLVFGGGCWYTIESKAKGEGQPYWMRLTKPMISLLLLQLVQLVNDQEHMKTIR